MEFKLYSIPAARRELAEALLRIEMSEYPARSGYIKALEGEGYEIVRLPSGGYSARSGTSAPYALPRYPCPHCGHQRPFAHYITTHRIEHPWCRRCRHENPAGAEQARASRDDAWKRGETPIRGNILCANPNCLNGGAIPPEKWKYNPRFCSRACQRAMNALSE